MDPEETEIVSWSLVGTDAGAFDISKGGVLMFKKSPDFEMAMDDGTDNMYSVTVQATDGTRKMGMKEVMVEVTNVEEPGMVTLSALRPQSATAFTATLTDPDDGITGDYLAVGQGQLQERLLQQHRRCHIYVLHAG